MSTTAVRLYGPRVISKLSATLVCFSKACNLLDPRVGHLLAHWTLSLPHCKTRWGEATIERGHKLVNAAEKAAACTYNESLITIRAMELVVGLKARKPVSHPAKSLVLLENRAAVSMDNLHAQSF